MRISVNLASRPFIEIRPLLARLRIAMAVLALLALALGLWLHTFSARAAAAQARIDAVRTQTAALVDQRTRNEARMRQPQNRAVLDRSHFLNGVFAGKSFSWTAVMMDLERVLPPGVQVTSIDPQTSKSGDVTIRLRVSGDRDRAVALVRNLEHTSRFLQPRLSTEAVQTNQGANARQVSLQPETGPASVEFDILAGYNPLPEPKRRPVVSSVPASPLERADPASSPSPGKKESKPGKTSGLPRSPESFRRQPVAPGSTVHSAAGGRP